MDDKAELQALIKEHNRVLNQYRQLLLVAAAMLGGGAVFFHIVERLSWLNAFYFCTMTLTTVGYGDIVPTTPAGKLFDIFYVLVGIGIIAAFANILIKNAGLKRQINQHRKKMSRAGLN